MNFVTVSGYTDGVIEDILFTPAVFLASALVLYGLVRGRLSTLEWKYAVYGLWAHAVAVFAQIAVTLGFYASAGGGDIVEYWRSGVVAADGLRTDFETFAPQLVLAFFHQEYRLPFDLFGTESTLSQTVISGALCLLLGNSLYAISMAVAMFAFFGKIALALTLRTQVSAARRHQLFGIVLLVPSVAFWSGTIVKEAIIIGCLGFATLALSYLVRLERLIPSVVVLAAAVVPIAMVKPYTLLPFSLAGSLWFYLERLNRMGRTFSLRPLSLAAATGIAVLSVSAVGAIVPEYSLDNLGARASTIQSTGALVEGGSNYQLVDNPSDAESRRPLVAQLAYAPLGLFTALFRPLPFDVRNVLMAVSALEATYFLVLFLRLLRRVGVKTLVSQTLRSPALAMCAAFTIMFGTAVGVASTNMGTLSRYRTPLLPFFAVLLAALTWRNEQQVKASSPRVAQSVQTSA